MKKVFATLAIAVLACFSANAQEPGMKVCKKPVNKICRPCPGKKTSLCCKPNYAQSFDVCKNESGYYICCEPAGAYNTTYSGAARALGETAEEDAGIPANANANGSQTKMCGKGHNKVCKASDGRACYNTHYAQSYDVCKNEHGYYICCEPPAYNNTTYIKQR